MKYSGQNAIKTDVSLYFIAITFYPYNIDLMRLLKLLHLSFYMYNILYLVKLTKLIYI